MCRHGIYAGATATDDEVIMDCPKCTASDDTLRRIQDRVVVNQVSGCWDWQGAKNDQGYGQMWISGEKKARYTHRLSYEAAVGPIPAGLHIDHLCRNRGCCNPDHLEPVTARENTHRGVAPSILLNHANRCGNGHDLSTEGYRRKDGGGRVCKACSRERRKKLYALARDAAALMDMTWTDYVARYGVSRATSESNIKAVQRSEKLRDWSEEDRRDHLDELAILRAAREDMSGIHDTGDAWY